jgi:adenine-specific DNA-methyltransferase
MVETAPLGGRVFELFNRKYLGSKRLLGSWIMEEIRLAAGVPASLLDGFCGTGAVTAAASAAGVAKVTAVDNLLCNCVILRAFCGIPDPEEERSLAGLIPRLNSLSPSPGYITENYAGAYFTVENCGRMDAVREEIAAMRGKGEISGRTHDYLLAGFLMAADRVANTIGQYDAFLKNIDSRDGISAGRHLVDERVRTPFALKPLARVEGGEVEVLDGDILRRISELDVEAAYLDPPYNGRQYCDNYHVLENLARWEKPPLYGKTRKFDRTALRSPFCSRVRAGPALSALLERVRADHVFLSYSSEGILKRGEIEGILSRFGKVRASEFSYPVFGNGAGVSRKRNLTEYLFHLRLGGRRG